MYLPSRSKVKISLLILAGIFLLFLSFKSFVSYLLFFTAERLFSPQTNSQKTISTLEQEMVARDLKLAEYKTLLEENDRLRKALDFKTKTSYQLTGAEVLVFSPSAWQRLVVISAGRDQGIEKGFFAIDAEGNLAGKIVEVDKNFSRLMLVSDPDFSAPVFIGKNNLGLFKGGLAGAQVLYIEDAESITVGDPVSLKVSQLPIPLEIGKVKRLTKDSNSLFWDLEVELIQKKGFFSKVYIIK